MGGWTSAEPLVGASTQVRSASRTPSRGQPNPVTSGVRFLRGLPCPLGSSLWRPSEVEFCSPLPPLSPLLCYLHAWPSPSGGPSPLGKESPPTSRFLRPWSPCHTLHPKGPATVDPSHLSCKSVAPAPLLQPRSGCHSWVMGFLERRAQPVAPHRPREGQPGSPSVPAELGQECVLLLP